ncbi:MAG: iron ABC transporter permease [Thermoleophilia bacterium]
MTDLSPSVRRGPFAGAPRRTAPGELVLVGTVAAVVAALALVPTAYLVWRSLSENGAFTLDHYRSAYSTVGIGTLAFNSLWFALGSSAVAVVAGTLTAYLVVRTDVPGRRLLFLGSVAPLVIPGVLYTVAWIFLASPRAGLLNAIPGVGLNVYSGPGMVLAEGFHLAPLVFLLMAAAFTSVDPALEEAATLSGARPRAVALRVTLPLVRPALIGAAVVTLVRTIESFEVPALVGIPAGIWVFTSRVWRAMSIFPADVGQAAAYSVTLLVPCVIGLAVLVRATRGLRRFQTVSGRGFRGTRVELGRWRRPAGLAAAIYVSVAAALPVLALGWISLQRFYGAASADDLRRLTLSNYGSVLDEPATLRTVWNTLLVGAGAATVVVITAVVIGWVVVRTRIPGRTLLDATAFLPLALPGIVLGLSLLVVYVRSPLPVYGTLWVLLIAYVTRYLPYGMRYATAALTQIGDDLEEAARSSGASRLQAFRRILVPLILPSLAAAWLYVLVVSARELSSAILLYSPGNEVLSVRIWELYEDGRLTELAALGVVMVAALCTLAGAAYSLSRRSTLMRRLARG